MLILIYVFQIDGNLGATAAIAEMLVQSDEECVRLLPALPEQWKEGRVKGLAVVGGAVLDMSWKVGRIEECIACSPRAVDMVFRYGSEVRVCRLEAGKSCQVF